MEIEVFGIEELLFDSTSIFDLIFFSDSKDYDDGDDEFEADDLDQDFDDEDDDYDDEDVEEELDDDFEEEEDSDDDD